MDPIATASYGMLAASRRFEASAQRTATMGVEGSTTSYEQEACLLYTSPSPRDQRGSRMPSSA